MPGSNALAGGNLVTAAAAFLAENGAINNLRAVILFDPVDYGDDMQTTPVDVNRLRATQRAVESRGRGAAADCKRAAAKMGLNNLWSHYQ